jgi:hypothetical protein
MPISEEQKQMQENFHLFFANFAQRLTAVPVAMTNNDKGGGEKKESYGRY